MNAPNTTFPYLTRARGRNVYEKLHKTLGAAKNGINGTGGAGQIYEWVDGGWNLLYDETGRPYSWQVAGIAKEKENTEKTFGITVTVPLKPTVGRPPTFWNEEPLLLTLGTPSKKGM